eukprot:m.756267 g.756267  ORF g.756267 m.756267 type:complete len:304 (-) comp59018_c0_seq19:3035-3946(-)
MLPNLPPQIPQTQTPSRTQTAAPDRNATATTIGDRHGAAQALHADRRTHSVIRALIVEIAPALVLARRVALTGIVRLTALVAEVESHAHARKCLLSLNVEGISDFKAIAPMTAAATLIRDNKVLGLSTDTRWNSEQQPLETQNATMIAALSAALSAKQTVALEIDARKIVTATHDVTNHVGMMKQGVITMTGETILGVLGLLGLLANGVIVCLILHMGLDNALRVSAKNLLVAPAMTVALETTLTTTGVMTEFVSRLLLVCHSATCLRVLDPEYSFVRIERAAPQIRGRNRPVRGIKALSLAP